MRAQKLKAAWRKKMSMGTHFGGITAEPDLFQLPGQKEFSKIKGAERADSDDEDSDEEGVRKLNICMVKGMILVITEIVMRKG
jgi:hypothetical protein